MSAWHEGPGRPAAFRHEALLYETDVEFVAGVVPFVLGGLEERAPVMVAVSAARRRLLLEALGAAGAEVLFADPVDVGRNPSMMVPAWAAFLRHHGGGARPRGVGEPAWAGRDGEELEECRRLEELLNLAFIGGRPWSLLCPYDVAVLPEAIVAGARRTHPNLTAAGASAGSADLALTRSTCAAPLEPRGPGARRYHFDHTTVRSLRPVVRAAAEGAGLEDVQVDALVLATAELVQNSLDHGGGEGDLTVWPTNAGLCCEVRDRGVMRDPLAGRVLPGPEQERGRGLWMVNHLCDLVQVRSSAGGTVVRVRMASPGPPVSRTA